MSKRRDVEQLPEDAGNEPAENDTVENDPEAKDLAEKVAPADRASSGPYDESEANPVRPYIDLGGIKVLPREGLNLRLEIEESTNRIVAVGLDYAESSLQVQPFAAPRSTGLWNEVREQIREQVTEQGGRIEEIDGPLGPELLAEVPVPGSSEKRLARFVGVDGPRWFLRGVIGGSATSDREAAEKVEDLFRSLVVVRGGSPMPPRDLLPLKMPAAPGAA